MMRSTLLAVLTIAFAVACSSTDDPTPAVDGGSAPTNDAEASGSADGAAGATNDTWSSYAQSFTATYCVECHEAGNTKRDYTKIDDVMRDKVEIRCGVASTKLDDCVDAFPPPKQFPIDNATKSNKKPSDAERDRFVKWIEAGLPE